LTEQERQIAPGLYRVISQLHDRLIAGEDSYAGLEERAAAELKELGLRTDYVAIRRSADLALPGAGDREVVILAAAYLGKARLIDNREVTR
jgi:pantoate--beta-alanine ligase